MNDILMDIFCISCLKSMIVIIIAQKTFVSLTHV